MPAQIVSANRPLDLWKGGLQDLLHRPEHNLPILDVLRSCAILLVITGHFAGTFKGSPRVMHSFFAYYGWTGVDLFLVLSGVLIGAQLWKELNRTGDIRVGRFLLRRGLRIWPLYYAFVALVGLEVLLIGRDGTGLWADATYLSDYFRCQIGGSWSLSIEEQFYILAPLLIVAFKKAFNPQRMWIIPAAALVLLNVARAVTVWHSPLPGPVLRQMMYPHIHTHADGLALGMLLAWMSVMRPQWLASPSVRWPIAGAMLAAGILIYRLMPIITNFTALALIYGSFTLVGMTASRIPALLNWHGFYVVSRLSFGMYLNHFGLLEHLWTYIGGLRTAGGELGFWLCYMIALLLSVALACMTFLLIEWPFLRLRSIWLSRKPITKATAMPVSA